MKTETIADQRLDRMIEIADSEDLSLDYVFARMARVADDLFEAMSENPKLLRQS